MIRLIIHRSASTFGNAILINSWHLKNGWSGIGYHAVILNGWLTKTIYNKFFDGVLESGRPWDDNNRIDPFEVGAHTFGQNTGTLSVCMIGDKDDPFTTAQLETLTKYCLMVKEIFGEVQLFQHSDFDKGKPLCAGLSKQYIKELQDRVNNTKESFSVLKRMYKGIMEIL